MPWRTNRTEPSGKPSKKDADRQELEAVSAVRDALARVIAGGSHSDRACAIGAIQAIDRGWEDDVGKYTFTFRLGKVVDARFDLLGSFQENTDELPPDASTTMQAALYTVDHLAHVLLARLTAMGMAVYPITESASGELLELPCAEQDPLLDAVSPPPAG
ncbi:MAG: hypothetical protein OXE79_11015 [Acidimicrobiaceae bacterium]|nr:hypothetical protein [Acidimicrobiaceae bacterium]MCY4175407.1 hypothetical protein [Acidimicrobiaceae bacterium]MCY4280869.1 hypothetical protein [Acidimicrobiaceae bacterium]MCY4294192.1 hypothetical protein [Acidimicrobiaceae bacterium]